MHELLRGVLVGKRLSKAGELFSLEDGVIIDELPQIVEAIRSTISSSDFVKSQRDQSLVEICVARLTSAIRECRSVGTCAPHLVSLLSTCLSYDLRPEYGEEPSHAKISSEILSCLFLNSREKGVLGLTVPLSVQFLHKSNAQLSKNISSYLALAANENPDLLARHLQPIIDSVITGNYSLARVLPLIYSANKEPIKNHVMTLVSIMPNCDRSGKLALLSLFSLIAKDNSTLLESSISQISEELSYSSTAVPTLQVFFNMVSVKVSKPLLDHRQTLKDVAFKFPKTIPLVVQILCTVSLSKQECSYDTLDFILSIIDCLEKEKHSIILKELAALVARYPSLLTRNVINRLGCIESQPGVLASTKAYILELKQNLILTDRSNNLGYFKSENSVNLEDRISFHESTPKFNYSVYDSKLGLNKSMTRLTSSQHSVPFNSSCNARSAGSINNRMSKHFNTGTVSPTKSMSSGSVPFVEQQQVVKVNVSQINQDLIRQVSSVQSYKNLALLQPHSKMNYIINSSENHLISLPLRSSQGSMPCHNSGSIFIPSRQLYFGVSSSTSASYQPTSCMSSSHQSITADVSSNRKTRSNAIPSERGKFHKFVFDSGYSESSEHKNLMNYKTTSDNRISIFEPYPLRDTVQHFCEKHLNKIKIYMESLNARLPLPVKCTIEQRKGKKQARIHFSCQERLEDYCLYKNTFYSMKTRNPKTWIHIMFLSLQARSSSALSTREISVSSLRNCWEILKHDTIPFVTLVTGAFPHAKEQDSILYELRTHRFFDVFEYNGPKQHWGCFLCNHPDRASFFIQEHEPVIEGQLKEKKGGRWKIFKKWKSRYFTLSGAKLSYKESVSGDKGTTRSLDVGSIRSVKVSRDNKRNIPKAFEIFTNERTFILKADDGSHAQEWIQCLSVAKARSQAREMNLKKLAYGGSLGRLNNCRALLKAQTDS